MNNSSAVNPQICAPHASGQPSTTLILAIFGIFNCRLEMRSSSVWAPSVAREDFDEHVTDCIMRVWTTASGCHWRASASRNMQLHAVSAPDWRRICSRRLFSKKSDFSDRGYAQRVCAFVRRRAQSRISFLSGMRL